MKLTKGKGVDVVFDPVGASLRIILPGATNDGAVQLELI
jgi:NADPH:quinone reductase-like Zn-dependent oxidoreductase